MNLQRRKKYILKQKVERAKTRTTKSGKVILEKTIKVQTICKCHRSCPTIIDVLQQNNIFKSYYENCDWTQKTLYIRSNVKKTKTLDSTENLAYSSNKKRMSGWIYSLPDDIGVTHTVCRDFFINCLQITPTRVYSAVNSVNTNPPAKERRGARAPVNKTTQSDARAVETFIASFPSYESHYGRNTSAKKYLPSTLNLVKLYTEYVSTMEFRQQEPISEFVFREIFNTKFNLCFKRRHTDTCKTCDLLQIQSIASGNNLLNAEQQNLHHESVKDTYQNFKSDVEKSLSEDEHTVILTFDLQKTLETPSLTTNIAYYKRQLWTYNFCVFDETKKKG